MSNKNHAPQNGNGQSKKNHPDDTEKSKKGYEKFEDTLKGTVKNIKDSEFYNYASSNREQTVSYVLLALGIIFLFINSFLGGLIVGAVAGYHFSKQIVYYLRNLNNIFEGHEQINYIILTGTLLALFIAAPGIFIGAVLVAIFKEIFLKKKRDVDLDEENPIDSTQRNYKDE